jgi:hypothetical protein
LSFSPIFSVIFLVKAPKELKRSLDFPLGVGLACASEDAPTRDITRMIPAAAECGSGHAQDPNVGRFLAPGAAVPETFLPSFLLPLFCFSYATAQLRKDIKRYSTVGL